MDPALWEVLKRESGGDAAEVEATIRLDRPHLNIAGVRIVSRFGPIATCRLRKDSILSVKDEESVRSLKAPRLLGPEVEPEGENARWKLPATVLASDVRRPPGLPLTGAGVVIGIIDWGCDFNHPHFKHRDGSTRLIALWDQRPRASPLAGNHYGYGSVYSRQLINRALTSTDPYNALGYHPADADPAGFGAHGTHVMDIAAGNGIGGGPMGMAPEADLIFVHLANKGTGGLANLGDSVRILEALDFVARTAGNRPWVVNLSVGRHGGPHDGTTLAEMAFDFVLREKPGCFIVQSTGNYFDKSIHSSGRLQTGQVRFFRLKVDEADTTPNELEVWYAGGDSIAVRAESPTGVMTHWVRLGERADIVVWGRIVGRIYNRASDPNNLDNHIDLFLYSTAPPGVWIVALTAEKVSDSGVFHAWIERDEACPSCQATFNEFDSDISCTTGTLANSHIPLVVGAYNAHSPIREIAPFSSVGPTRDNRPKPDLVAPGVGVLAARSAPRDWQKNHGLLTRKSGASMAAPHVTGVVALCLQGASRPLWSHEIRELILNNVDPGPDYKKRAPRYGRGYLNSSKVVDAVLELYSRARSYTRTGLSTAQEKDFNTEDNTMKPKPKCCLERLEDLINGSASGIVSDREVLAELIGSDDVTNDSLEPDGLFHRIVNKRNGGLLETTEDGLSVLARPGESPDSPPQAGDVLLRVALGEYGLGHVAVISDDKLWSHKQLAGIPVRPESHLPGYYASVIEGGSFPHTRSDRFARRILDLEGRMLPGQLLLRPKPAVFSISAGDALPSPPDTDLLYGKLGAIDKDKVDDHSWEDREMTHQFEEAHENEEPEPIDQETDAFVEEGVEPDESEHSISFSSEKANGQDFEEPLSIVCEAEGSETEEEIDEESELPATPSDGWVVPEDVKRAGEAQHVKYDDAPLWDASKHNCVGRLSDGASDLREHLKSNFAGISEIGGLSCRPNTASPSKLSIHGTGRALDIMIPTLGGNANGAVGDPIANWLVLNASLIGIQYLIWNRVRWSGGRKQKFARYTGPNKHTDHIHVELNIIGAERKTPWFSRRTAPLGAAPGELVNYHKAAKQNRSYGQSLGWQHRLSEITPLLGLASQSPNDRDFADAVARWQKEKKLESDGILGPKTWSQMQQVLHITPTVASPPQTRPTAPITRWETVPLNDRITYVMRRLTGEYGLSVKGAAGLTGNLMEESGVIPSRLEGSKQDAPMNAPDFSGNVRSFTAEEAMNRDPKQKLGPRKPGIGLAQWTAKTRRAGLFQHRYQGRQFGSTILFSMDAQIDYLVHELRTSYGSVYRLLTGTNVTLEDASDEVVYSFERPGSILIKDPASQRWLRLSRDDSRVQEVFKRRREAARRALKALEQAASGITSATNQPS